MSFTSATGFSVKKNAMKAINEAFNKAKSQIQGEVSFVLVYFTIYYPVDELENAFQDVFQNIPNAGCSGEGVIGQNAIVEGNEPGVSITVFSGKKVNFYPQIFENINNRNEEVGIEVSHWMRKKNKLKALIVLPDAVNCNFSFLKKGIEKDFNLFNRIPILGGLAADDLDLKATYQLFNNKIFTNSVVSIALCGKFKYGHVVNHGCVPSSDAMIVTKSENNIIYEINGKPALDVIFDYSTIDESSNWGVVSINMCLAIKSPQEFRDQYDEYLIRFMVTCDTEKRSIGMSANIQEGTEVWIARRSLDKIDEGVISLATSVKNNLKNRRPLYIFHFDCGGRGRVIMDEDHKMRNLRFMQREVGESIPWSGFYTYGEIAPVANENCFHSYTAVLFYLYE